MALFDRYKRRRSSIWVLAKGFRLRLLVGIIALMLLFAALTGYILFRCIWGLQSINLDASRNAW